MSPIPPFPIHGIRPTLKELIALREQARLLDLAPRGRVLATRSGGHLSRFRGRGMAFEESRVYQPGDDPRRMDWRVTARTGTPHIKLFQEERERPVWLLVDQSASMRFGSRVAFKSVIAAQAAALLGWAAVDRGDCVGGLVFDETHYLQQHPRTRSAGLLPLLERLSTAPAPSERSGCPSLPHAAMRLCRHLRPGSLIAVISDFAGIQREQSGWLARLATGQELLLIMVSDPLEAEPPPPGQYPVTDGQRWQRLNLTNEKQRIVYQSVFQQRLETVQRLAHRHHAHLLRLTTPQPVGAALAQGLGARLSVMPGWMPR
ncbi:DUF58 domain-containing protein [Chromatium okenii]|uniref:DUF58 domain-containing protein n=1 Tax=Chromatium okenii TaxID=61644 RepID=A0A2S7XTW0_9GAMM|nr:DUF58 domain-containing protein [Chromatium okenii]PQJ97140.1 DUF58 domain-containing protein [Chromatium okenii]